MCPICLTTALLSIGGAASGTGGIVVLGKGILRSTSKRRSECAPPVARTQPSIKAPGHPL
jgi:hypothetical protein